MIQPPDPEPIPEPPPALPAPPRDVQEPAHEHNPRPGYAEDRHPKLRYELYHEEKAKRGLALTMCGGSSNIAPDSPTAFGQIYSGGKNP